MGILDVIKGQFLDVIEYEDISNKILVYKYVRPDGSNEIKQGAQLIVRESQKAVFLKSGTLADIFDAGTHTLSTNNLPVLSKLGAFPFGFISPIISDIFFVSTRQFIDNEWGTKNPIIKRDAELNMMRIKAFGKFAFRVIDIEKFMKEFVGTKGIILTFEIIQYLSSMITEAFAVTAGSSDISILDLASEYRSFSEVVQIEANKRAQELGIEFSDVLIENVSLPEEVEKLIDEQSGIGMAKKDMNTFMQYQTARAMRDASKQKGGLAGLGAGMAFGKHIANTVENTTQTESTGKSKAELLRELKELFDEGILTEEEFVSEKKKILG